MAILPFFHDKSSHSKKSTQPEATQENEEPQSYAASQEKSQSPNIPQRIERRLALLNASGNIYRRWLVELISLGISAFCMAWIIGMLIYLQDKRLSAWPLGDPQTIITVLAKIAAASLIIPTSEAIGQLKWNWFNGKTSKEIYDFEIFDKASRGPWGSFMLLIVTKGKSLVALGAVLTLLMLAIDTFFQQVMSVPEGWEIYSNVPIRRVVQYKPIITKAIVGGMETYKGGGDMTATLNKFTFSNGTQLDTSGNGTQAEIPVTCPTSNCTWPAHETLGVCSACEDISELLTFACLYSEIDWASNVNDTEGTDPSEKTNINGTICGYFLNETRAGPLLMSGYSVEPKSEEALLMRALPLDTTPWSELFVHGSNSFKFKDIRYPMVNFVVSSSPGGYESVYRNETPVAQECVLYWCVKNIQSTSYLANYTETTLSTFTNKTPPAKLWDTVPFTNPGFASGVEFTFTENITIKTNSAPDGLEFGMSNESHILTALEFSTFLPSFTTARNKTDKPVMRFSLYSSWPSLRVLNFNPWLHPGDIPKHVGRLATAMSNVMRATSTEDVVLGTAYTMNSRVVVEWGWITYPLVLLVLSAVFLIATIRRTSNQENEVGVWKTSTMPTLIYGLPPEEQEYLKSRNGSWDSGRGQAPKSTRIQLLPNKGWRVSKCSSVPVSPVVRRNEDPFARV